MKTTVFSLISLVILSNCFGNTLANENCKEIRGTKGIYVIRYIKTEVEALVKNENLKKEGKSYDRMVDLKKVTFFLPIIDKDENISDTIKKWNPFKQKRIYLLPISLRSKEYLKKFCPKKAEIMELGVLPKDENCVFYKVPKDEKYLYQIYYMEGDEFVIELENNEMNKIKLDLSDEIDKKEKIFKVHFIYRLTNVIPNKNVSGLVVWK